METAWLLIVLIASSAFVGQARQIPRPRQRSIDNNSNEQQLKRVTRQADDGFGSVGSMISLAIKYGPLLFKAFNTISGLASTVAGAATDSKVDVKPTKAPIDRVETPAVAAAAADPFSWSNLLSVGIKVALALVSSYTSDGIDKSDTISPTQAVMGTVLSALTGSEDPKEVAFFAKQADEVVGLVISLVEAVYTSVTS